jgi:hypothetical protein
MIHDVNSINQLAEKVGGLPPIEWHVNNITQLLTKLKSIAAADIWLVEDGINQVNTIYSVFLNSYEKAERIMALTALRDCAYGLANHVMGINFEHYQNNAVHKWGEMANTFKTDGGPILPLEKYINISLSCFVGIHDFALGLGKVCEQTDPEPYGQIYNQLERGF